MLWLCSRQPHLLPSLIGLIISRQLWNQLCKQDHLEMFTIKANLNVITSYPEDIHIDRTLPFEISSTSRFVCTCIKWNAYNDLKWPDDWICCPMVLNINFASSLCSQKQHFCKGANFTACRFSCGQQVSCKSMRFVLWREERKVLRVKMRKRNEWLKIWGDVAFGGWQQLAAHANLPTFWEQTRSLMKGSLKG